ncbi:MAG: DUF4372 domain-containing protein [Acidobacteria bacterium]|nr:DUF4372 domain-containing protein [Acidobacteriota bacterium]
MSQVSSIFSQILRMVRCVIFDDAVKKSKAERHARGFRCWDQFCAMMFCQIGNAKSLREISGGLASCGFCSLTGQCSDFDYQNLRSGRWMGR